MTNKDDWGALSIRAINILKGLGYASPQDARSADPEILAKQLLGKPNCGRKTIQDIHLLIGLIKIPDKLKEITDVELIHELHRRGYVVSRPL